MHRLEFLQQYLKPGKILDIGNLEKGGAVHRMLMERFPECDFYGLDIVDQSTIGVHFPHQTIGSFEHMDYPNDFFDVIYMGEVIEHTWRPKEVLDNAWRILSPGGRLILDTPNVYSLSRMIRFLLTAKDIILGNPEHKIFFSPAMLDNMLKQAGFEVRVIASEVNFDTRRFKCRLPDVGPFKMMGECLMVLAEKPV